MWKLSKSKIEPPRCFQERALWQGAEPNSTFRVKPRPLGKSGFFFELRPAAIGRPLARHKGPHQADTLSPVRAQSGALVCKAARHATGRPLRLTYTADIKKAPGVPGLSRCHHKEKGPGIKVP